MGIEFQFLFCGYRQSETESESLHSSAHKVPGASHFSLQWGKILSVLEEKMTFLNVMM